MSARLNKTQEYAILWMVSKNKTETDIIKELKISQEKLTKFLEKHNKQNNATSLKTTKSTMAKAKDMMISKTSGKNNSGVSIMTKEASQLGDDFHQKLPKTNRLDSIIHRPNND